MKPRSAIIVGGASLLLAVSAIGALLTLVALNAGGRAAVGPLSFQLAAGYDRAATARLVGRVSAVALDASARDSRAALSQYPYDNGAWLRLAYIDSLRPQGLSAQGISALETSYTLIAVDPTVANWWIRFCLQNWARVSPRVRKAAEHEFEALAANSLHRRSVTVVLRSVTDPAGGLVAGLWLSRMAANPRR